MHQSNSRSNAKSVIAIYWIESDDIDTLDYWSIWSKYVVSKVKETVCRNIFHCDMVPSDMLKKLSNEHLLDHQLKDLIKEEKECGANYIFVGPVVGDPIGGFSIETLLN
jgi:hypothetical protein